MPTCPVPRSIWKKTRSPNEMSASSTTVPAERCASVVLGSRRLRLSRNTDWTNAEQSTPLRVVPPKRYGVPFHDSTAARIASRRSEIASRALTNSQSVSASESRSPGSLAVLFRRSSVAGDSVDSGDSVAAAVQPPTRRASGGSVMFAELEQPARTAAIASAGTKGAKFDGGEPNEKRSAPRNSVRVSEQ